MKIVRFLFTTLKGFFSLLGILAGLVVAGIGALLLFGPPGVDSEPVASETKGEIEPRFDVDLDPLGGQEIGLVYQSWLSPQQEAEEESDAPDNAPDVFLSTEPS